MPQAVGPLSGDSPLVVEHGALVNGRALRRLMGFRSESAFRSAVLAGRVPVAVFPLPGRKGLFAKTAEVERWLRSLPRANPESPDPEA